MKKELEQYLETALWSSTGEDDRPLDDKYDTRNFTRKARLQAERELKAFFKKVDEVGYVAADRAEEEGRLEEFKDSLDFDGTDLAHNFWLSRNGHGAGFFDKPEKFGELAGILQRVAKQAGERYIEVYGDALEFFPNYAD